MQSEKLQKLLPLAHDFCLRFIDDNREAEMLLKRTLELCKKKGLFKLSDWIEFQREFYSILRQVIEKQQSNQD